VRVDFVAGGRQSSVGLRGARRHRFVAAVIGLDNHTRPQRPVVARVGDLTPPARLPILPSSPRS
jgi:hypothetical protein